MKGSDYNIERDIGLAIPAGRIPYASYVNKYGIAPTGIQTSLTDIWDRADATPTQQIWSRPDAATTHFIASTSANDAYPSGSGARTIRIYGLTDWDTKEISEDIQMNGLSNVETVNKYVIIHRMHVLTNGTGSINNGNITATTNDLFSYVTAQINAFFGQTEMAIYGIPSCQTAYLTNWYASIHKSSPVGVDAQFRLSFLPDVGTSQNQYIVKEVRGLESAGTSNMIFQHFPYKVFKGPGILKVQAIGSAADIEGAAGFDLILLEN